MTSESYSAKTVFVTDGYLKRVTINFCCTVCLIENTIHSVLRNTIFIFP